METTLDKLLNGRFTVEQPSKGYRIAVDTLLLAAAVSVQKSQRVLDLGCGVGGVMLALATRVHGAFITGIEIQPDLVSLCASNIIRNGFEDFLNVRNGDVTVLDKTLDESFHHVVMNPPFHDGARHGGSPNQSKRKANTEEAGEIGQWILFAGAALCEGGALTMITRADRQEETLAQLTNNFGMVLIKPIWSKADGTCKRIILRATKGGKEKVVLQEPFILYGHDGRYSVAGDLILREAREMVF